MASKRTTLMPGNNFHPSKGTPVVLPSLMTPVQDCPLTGVPSFSDKYARPPLDISDYLKAHPSLLFQVIDVESDKGSPSTAVSAQKLQDYEEVPFVLLYGVTREGYSVFCHCYNFEPYLFIEAPVGWTPALGPQLAKKISRELTVVTKLENCVVRVETYYKSGLLYFRGGKKVPHLKIVMKMPQHVSKVRSLLSDSGLIFEQGWNGRMQFRTYESNVIFPLRFLVDNDVGGCNWVEIQTQDLHVMPFHQKTSFCQIEVECSCEKLKNHEPVGEYMAIAPFRILSIDIECQGRKGFFPEAERDPVIQIANYVVQWGGNRQNNEKQSQNSNIGLENEAKDETKITKRSQNTTRHKEKGTAERGAFPLLVRAIFAVGTCSSIAGADVYSYATEPEMLCAWIQFVRSVDPDILTGYNVVRFDFPYLVNRANALKIQDRFCYWSRQVNSLTVVKQKHFMSKQMGNRDFFEVNVEGRVIVDVMVVIQRDYQLRTYSLNAVSQHFLNEQKEDVHHSIISDLQGGNCETRRRLAVYCLKDAYLPIKLIEKLMIIVNNVEMARVTGVPIAWLLERGQQIKVFSQILRKAKSKNLLFPAVDRGDMNGPNSGGVGGGPSDGVGYEGATVIDPVKGFYNCPIVTLDFASLYPSIMMAHNICYSTLIPKNEVYKYPSEQVSTTPAGDSFIKEGVYCGILPEILEELLSARKQAKMMMKDAHDSLEYAVFNGRQLALKISANSVYGFTGAQVGKLPCLEISSSVTAFGRKMIETTKQLMEINYPGINVIYGDTDSVMINCITDENKSDKERIEQAMSFGRTAADFVSATFKKPIKLEFEKVYFPYLLMNKKRYAGLLWTNSEKYDKLDAKGIETVRRDNCPLIASVISGVLNRILIQRSVESAVQFVKGTISDLLMNRLDISQLVISKAFSKSEDEYEGQQAHIVLMKKMRARDPANAPTMGDRIPYVIIKAAKGAKTFEKSEDPIYVLEHNTPIDTQYYLEHCLTPPLLRVFEGVIPDPQSLVIGEHTRHVAVPPVSSSAAMSGLMKFVKVQTQCLSCKRSISTPLPSTTSKGVFTSSSSPAGKSDETENGGANTVHSPLIAAVCSYCKDVESDVYVRILAKRNYYESCYNKVWVECQQCQGSLYQEVICTSRDCPVFYMRKKVQKDLQEQQALLDRFGVMDFDW